MRQGLSQPVALTSGDFDEDGMPDLVSGYVAPSGGILAIYRGNSDSVFPSQRGRAVKDQDSSLGEGGHDHVLAPKDQSPFISPATVFEVPELPERLGTGDFDGDSHQDIVMAARGSNALWLLSGDGRGGLKPAERVALPGRVTALETGQINRRDGLTDVVVGIIGRDGPQVLIFESPRGALRDKPEAVSLPSETTALAMGRLDDDEMMDLAVLVANRVVIIHGRDRRLSLDAEQQTGVPPAAIDQLSLPFVATSLALGDFIWDRDHRTDMAVLSADGVVHFLERIDTAGRRSSLRAAQRPGLPTWYEHNAVSLPTAIVPEGSALSRVLVQARVSSLPVDNLVVIDQAHEKLHIVVDDPRIAPGSGLKEFASSWQHSIPVSLDVEGPPVAVLPMQLNQDALSDLVILRDGQSEPTVVLTAPMTTFVVNSTGDRDDSNLTDGVCDDGTGNCTLRAAIEQANSSAGADVITFNIPGMGVHTITPASPLPTITGPVVLDGTSQPGYAGTPLIELDGSMAGSFVNGLMISAGNSAVRGLAINRFAGDGIQLTTTGGTSVVGNFLGTAADGTTAEGNAGDGVFINNASGNAIGGAMIAARNIISGNGANGVLIFGTGATGNQLQRNLIGTDITGTESLGNSRDGVLIVGASASTIGGTSAGAGNIISGNATGIEITGNNASGILVQGNLIGTTLGGKMPLGNAGEGVSVDAARNTIGGTVAGAQNLISSNGRNGIFISGSGATGNLVQGNFIGADSTGTAALSNSSDGVALFDSTSNTIGGAASGAGNLISSNGRHGVSIAGSGATGNQVQGNLIGTTLAGTASLANAGNGVAVYAAQNTIGGTTVGARNIISGNNSAGILIFGRDRNTVQGNFIGTDVTGAMALENAGDGVSILFAPNNNIGGTTDAARNVISANAGVGVRVVGSSALGNTVSGNYIGTTAGGTGALSNSLGGVFLDGAPRNTIGGTVAGTGNVISANDSVGVRIGGGDATGNFVQGNLVGVDVTGRAALANSAEGILIDSAPRNTVGGIVPNSRNVVSGNASAGIRIAGSGATANVVLGNLIGTDSTGGAALANASDGLFIDGAPGTTIGGTTLGSRNVISGNRSAGIRIVGGGATGSLVQGNYIGTDLNGTMVIANGSDGVLIDGAPSSTIGGTLVNTRNVISGNNATGVHITGSSAKGNTVASNLIGTDVNGTNAVANGGDGVLIDGAPNSTIGGTTTGARNVISANRANGVHIIGAGATTTVIQGNFIGSDLNGTGVLSNGDDGIFIDGAPNNTIGGTASGTRNVISGNTVAGIHISGSDAKGNQVQGNLIGSDFSGTALLPNGGDGVLIDGAPSNTIGGTMTAARNLISGNNANGIQMAGSQATGNLAQGNFIGTRLDGTSRLGNRLNGVLMTDSASNNSIGGTSTGAGNVIAFNGASGVRIPSSDPPPPTGPPHPAGNAILSNSIFSNTGLGIDLGPAGMTPNDAGRDQDLDLGANNLQNFPAIDNAMLSGTSLIVSYSVPSSTANSSYPIRVEYFKADDRGQGQIFLGSDSYTEADLTKGIAKKFTLALRVAVLNGDPVVATATDKNGNTSEFSPVTAVVVMSP
jgi:CSLREA domain-containing protein